MTEREEMTEALRSRAGADSAWFKLKKKRMREAERKGRLVEIAEESKEPSPSELDQPKFTSEEAPERARMIIEFAYGLPSEPISLHKDTDAKRNFLHNQLNYRTLTVRGEPKPLDMCDNIKIGLTHYFEATWAEKYVADHPSR